MKNKKEKLTHYKELEESITYFPDSPETPHEMVNKYGTYEIQPTADNDFQYPAIAQGFNKKIIKTDRENEERMDNEGQNLKKPY